MNILITGSAGFIGYHLSKKLLDNNFKVIGIDNLNTYYDVGLKKKRLKELKKNKKFIFFKIDTTNYQDLEKVFNKKIDVVINLAAQAGVQYSLKNPRQYINSNIILFFNLLELSKKFKIKKILFASSSSVYGSINKKIFSEDLKVDDQISLYAATKKTNEILANYYSKLTGSMILGLRFFTVYGPYGRPDMSIFKFSNLIKKNKPIEVFNYGNHHRDFTYIDDCIDIVYKLIKFVIKKKSF